MNNNNNNSRNIFLQEDKSQERQQKLMVMMPRLEVIEKELRFSTQYLSAHKLYHSSKWAGEQLKGVTSNKQLANNNLLHSFVQNNSDPTYCFHKVYCEPQDQSLDDLLVARTLFDLREFRKCAFVLKKYYNDSEYQQALFLHNYSLFMAGQVKKEEEALENESAARTALNPELGALERNLAPLYKENKLCDVNLYLYGLVLKEREKKGEAQKCLVECLNRLPCMWSAWLELCDLLGPEALQQVVITIQDHWMKNFYLANYLLDKQQNSQSSIEVNINLCYFFKKSAFIQNMIAHAFYNEQEFDNSLEWFEKLVDKDPYRYENMDTYSNILYIKENQGELANLALRCFQHNKYTPETCCVVGNYYSLLGEHMKAILYFRKALKLDKNCQAAWTLMGHEYLEMKTVVGAIDAYRNATENDSGDFRAWYGLGQTYELQNMNHYALYYFSQAVQSKPKDPRMWNALGNCYQKLNKHQEAVKSFERADQCKDKECIALHSLAKLYDLMGNSQKAFSCFQKNYQRKDEDQIFDKEWAESILFCSVYQFQQHQYDQSTELARKLCDFNGPERDQANSLLIEINKINQNNHRATTPHNFNTPNNHLYQQLSANQVFVSNNLNKNTSNSHNPF